MKMKLADTLVERDPDAAHGCSSSSAPRRRPRSRTCATSPAASTRRCSPTRARSRRSRRRRASRPSRRRCEGDGVGRLDQDVEAAVYFSCLEALQNVAKYANASRVAIQLSNGDGRVTFEVQDDGVGFEPAANGMGTGLQGIADRLGALGGVFEVRSAPGAGTTVTGSVPIHGAVG